MFDKNRRVISSMFTILEHGHHYPEVLAAIISELVQLAPRYLPLTRRLSRARDRDARSVAITILGQILENSPDSKAQKQSRRILEGLKPFEQDQRNQELIESFLNSTIGVRLSRRLSRRPAVPVSRAALE